MTTQSMTWEAAVRGLIERPDKRALVEACYFDQPVARAAARYHASAEWQAVRAEIGPSKGRALDLGAGNGIASYALAKDGWTVDAVEPDPSELVGAGAVRALAATENLPITVVESFGEALPFDSESFDLVVARQVLHHARSLPGLCAELARLLRPGGRLVALRDHVINDPGQLAAFHARHPLHQLYGGEHAYTLAEYRSALQAAGLHLDREIRSLDSPINLAPMTPEDVAARIPVVGKTVAAAFGGGRFWRIAPLLSRIDRRPGRLVSYICRKPD
jgi:SAM-dependent methyltransferase